MDLTGSRFSMLHRDPDHPILPGVGVGWSQRMPLPGPVPVDDLLEK
ncbi:MAG: hypothetical protein R3231_04195 [bacterium]|nr:hypothetical protein [bacterium]